ncbi:MAG: hypothetical protein AAF488_16470 [Planctomycetota bacterium]
MGGHTIVVGNLDSVADWQALSTIISDSGYHSACDSEWTSSNHVGPIGFEKKNSDYTSFFQFCPGEKVIGALASGTVTTTITSGTCPSGGPNRVPDSRCYDFLQYVLREEPSEIMDQFPDSIVDYQVSKSGQEYQLELTFTPASGSDYVVMAEAEWEGSSFGPITVTIPVTTD